MKESPTLEDYLATGALANVPVWIYLLLLTFDANLYAESFIIIALLTGGFSASYLMCRRIKSRSFRNGLLFGVSATVVNFVFGFATLLLNPFVAGLCFVMSAVLAVVLRRRKDKELGT